MFIQKKMRKLLPETINICRLERICMEWTLLSL